MKIAIAKPTYSVDPVSKQLLGDALYDGYLEFTEEGITLRRRPGRKTTPFCDTGTGAPGQGLFWSEKLQNVIAVNGGKVFKITDLYGSKTELTGADLDVNNPVSFAEGQNLDNTVIFYLANGRKMSYSTGGNFTQIVSAAAPQLVNFMAYINQRFLGAEKDTNRFYFTDTNPGTGLMDPTYWDSTDNPLTCEAKGDNLAGLFSEWQEILPWGTAGAEFWQDDGSTPFSPLVNAFVKAGLIAPYSVKPIDNTWFALVEVDGKRAVIKLQGRTPVIISEDIAQPLMSYPTISDAIADVCCVGGTAFYILHFPTEEITWAYDYKGQYWQQWTDWVDGARQPFSGRHICYAKGWNKYLIQSSKDGKIYELDRSTFTDLGGILNTAYRTGNLGNGAWNVISLLMLKLKRGQGNVSGSEPSLLVKYRKNGSPLWSERLVSLGKQGHYEFIQKLRNLGRFQTIQFEFSISENADLALSSIEAI